MFWQLNPSLLCRSWDTKITSLPLYLNLDWQ